MIHARKDYTDRIQDKAKKIPAKEPVFLLRGQDEVGHKAVRAWAYSSPIKWRIGCGIFAGDGPC